MNEEILRELIQIKWILICLVTMVWGRCLYILGQATSDRWRRFKKERAKSEEKLSSLERMNRDLEMSVRTKKDCSESKWDV